MQTRLPVVLILLTVFLALPGAAQDWTYERWEGQWWGEDARPIGPEELARNLRAPSLQNGQVLIVGYSEDAYARL